MKSWSLLKAILVLVPLSYGLLVAFLFSIDWLLVPAGCNSEVAIPASCFQHNGITLIFHFSVLAHALFCIALVSYFRKNTRAKWLFSAAFAVAVIYGLFVTISAFRHYFPDPNAWVVTTDLSSDQPMQSAGQTT